MTWHLGPMLAYDCETTGVSVETDRIVTAAVVLIEPGHEPHIRSTVINPGVEIPESAAEIHGWTTERVQAEGREPAQELEWIAADLAAGLATGTPLVIANAPYDLTLLDRELRRHNLPTIDVRLDGKPISSVVDPMCLDKALDRYRPGKRKLTDLCSTYGARIDTAHDCTADALAAARVVFMIGQRAQKAIADPGAVRELYADRRYPENIVDSFQKFGRLTLAEVHAAQVVLYAKQAEGLARYWRQKATEDEYRAASVTDLGERDLLLRDIEDLRRRADGVSSEWPIRNFQAEAAAAGGAA
ncbi:exonuclease domain-containing protein [Micromonospora sp. NPDC000207]|uniref:exonuclease domain-containing protein n=1 Tax=Micromonospora sp. NPDC000207 TaxID=3154246 RepID=UPI003325427A